MDIVMGIAPRTRREPSGLCVVEIETRRGDDGQREEHFIVRHLERIPAGTSFPDMANRCGDVAKAVRDRTRSRPEIYVDATGFGQPLMDEVERRGDYRRAYKVYFTYGDRRNEQGDEVRLGKGWLVCRVKMRLQTGQIHLPKSTEAQTLAEELMDYEVQMVPDANDHYGAFRVGTHDELVTALGLVVQRPPSVTVEHMWLKFP